ncbi:MAG: hypothetical protein Q4D38_04205 [Planctomycetia bacterium]|nr:hypothetical protein [Planctomycetia bacterium]
MKNKSKKLPPDNLFHTRAGDTPPVLWGGAEKFWLGDAQLQECIEAFYTAARRENCVESSWLEFFHSRRETCATLSSVEDDVRNALLLVAATRARIDLDEIDLDKNMDMESKNAQCDPLVDFLRKVEIPFTIFYNTPSPTGREAFMLEDARRELSNALSRHFDDNGVPSSAAERWFRMWAASLTRLKFMEQASCATLFGDDETLRFEKIVRALLYFTRGDGESIFAHPQEEGKTWSAELFIAALQMDSNREDKALGVSILPGLKSQKAASLKKILPQCALDSAAEDLAILRSNWQNSPLVALRCRNRKMDIEIEGGRASILSGAWDAVISWNGEKLSPENEWAQVCRHGDDECEFVEWEQPWSQNFVLQRSALLSHKGCFALLADAVLGPKGVGKGSLLYRASCPIGDGIRFAPQERSFELLALDANDRRKARLLPIGLPEWKSQAGEDEYFEIYRGWLEYGLHSRRASIFAPIFVDLKADRLRAPLTWRRLAVGENLKKVSSRKAVAFRVMISDEQWLFYRSLGPIVPRSVLGAHLYAEYVAARFLEIGQTVPILIVDSREGE